jgi:hypothetical protein
MMTRNNNRGCDEKETTERRQGDGNVPHRHWYFIILFVILPLIFFLRSHTFREPLEADEAIYAIIAQDWIDGGKPYLSLWDNKPIGTFIIYRIAISLFGYNELAPKLLAAMSMALTTAFLLWFLIKENIDPIVTALLLVVWSLIGTLVSCHANGANSEVFIIPFLSAAFVFLREYRAARREMYFWLAVIALTASFLIKQVTLPYFLIPFLALPASEWRQKNNVALRLGGVFALVLISHLSVYGACGYSPDLLIDQFKQNRHHIASEVDNSLTRFLKTLFLFPFDRAVQPITLLILGGIAGVFGRSISKRANRSGLTLLYFIFGRNFSKEVDQSSLTLLYFIFGTAIAIAIPGENLPHYYILILPFLVPAMLCICSFFTRPWQVLFLVIVICDLSVTTYATYLKKHPNEISYSKYGGDNWFVRDRYIGQELLKKRLTGKRIYVDGTHPGIFFYSQNKPANRYFVAWTYTMMDVTTWDEVFAELKTSPPDMCVILNPLVNPFKSWVGSNYILSDSIAGSKIYLANTSLGLKRSGRQLRSQSETSR